VPTTTSDYYAVLGVARTATKEEIQRAYRKLARRFHPDVSQEPDAEARFKEINAAYEVLSNPEKRAQYDNPAPPPNEFGPRFQTRDFDPGEFDFGGLNFQDLFGAGGFTFTAPPTTIEAEIELTLEDVYAGGRHTLSLQTPTGVRTHDVNIPAGVLDGQRIRVPDTEGDWHLVVRIAPHRRYAREGRDLTVTVAVAPWDAVLGTTVPVDTPGGPVEVKVPAGSSSGRRLRLRGRGLPNPKGAAGDLFAELKIATPTQLTDAQRALWEQLAQLR
jgi:curved DNA-binding protein